MASSSASTRPRIVIYHQTTHNPDGSLISILPLITQPDISLTHIIVAAIHINDDPDKLTLNDHPPSDPRYVTTWAELRIAQASDIKVMGMLGGAAKGSYARLDQDQATFETYYGPLYDLIRERDLDGLDLDVEENMSLSGIVRLIDRLRADFGPDFIITLAPVAAALIDVRRNLSGFDYETLEVMRGKQIAWYNTQFYCGWGDASNPVMYEICVARGWSPEKVVIGLVTTPDNGPGWVPFEILKPTLALLRRQFPTFGGVMGWEYFNGQPGGKARPWEWAQRMTELLGNPRIEKTQNAIVQHSEPIEIDPDVENGPKLETPQNFEYYSDGSIEDDGN
ncbi:glycoside hydrolase family 18 protein [Hypoxylon fragiforme]|uniref:glycoside hydrolase family 18 protein n=1 Tax=Hypoxylon fragiforme TaxID=63214 RepID=UPI0020C637CD|nr:glycoside hydrolase family 18 protein [Hypoxylon fragiforme]KAI2608569.1 glycoside hydrolase family 18 protein [Hypoxylon fragiforme]